MDSSVSTTPLKSFTTCTMVDTDPPFSSIRYLPTNEAYDRWAPFYDNDGNFLVALDDLQMRTFYPSFLGYMNMSGPRPWHLIDLGCGTGRNTARLLTIPGVTVVGLDNSQGMLDAARARLGTIDLNGQDNAKSLHLEVFDMLSSTAPPEIAKNADGLISTLVIEHIPLPVFFSHASQMLHVGGSLMVTNMHPEMGRISQAGFVDTSTGEKIRPMSYPHAAPDILHEARKWGFEAYPNEDFALIEERAVEDSMVDQLGPRSRKWVGTKCWLGGIFRKVSNKYGIRQCEVNIGSEIQ